MAQLDHYENLGPKCAFCPEPAGKHRLACKPCADKQTCRMCRVLGNETRLFFGGGGTICEPCLRAEEVAMNTCAPSCDGCQFCAGTPKQAMAGKSKAGFDQAAVAAGWHRVYVHPDAVTIACSHSAGVRRHVVPALVPCWGQGGGIEDDRGRLICTPCLEKHLHPLVTVDTFGMAGVSAFYDRMVIAQAADLPRIREWKGERFVVGVDVARVPATDDSVRPEHLEAKATGVEPIVEEFKAALSAMVNGPSYEESMIAVKQAADDARRKRPENRNPQPHPAQPRGWDQRFTI